jgi:hypothetical protein
MHLAIEVDAVGRKEREREPQRRESAELHRRLL